LRALVDVARQAPREDGVTVALTIEKGVQIGDWQSCDWIAFGHDSRLGQVINNLIDNARSFSEPGGQVRVTLRRVRVGAPESQPPRRGRAGAPEGQPSRRGFEIWVDDDGPGIPAHAFERIFERFYTDRPTQSFGQNSGLGLSISRQIVEAHGGSISATNRLDGEENILGARFVVFLPAAASE